MTVQHAFADAVKTQKPPQDDIYAFLLAAEKGDLSMVRSYLEQFGANIINKSDVSGFTALHLTATHNRLDCLNLLIENKANLNIPDGTGATPVILATYYKSTECLQALIAAEANIYAREPDGMDALCYAAQGNDAIGMEMLLTQGAEVNHKTKNKWTPFMFLTKHGRDDCVELLMNKGADLTLKNEDHETVFDIAKREGTCDELLLGIDNWHKNAVDAECAILRQGTQKSIHIPRCALKLQKPLKQG